MARRRSRSMALVLEALQQHQGHLTEAQAAQLLGVSTSWFRHDFKRQASTNFRTVRLQTKLGHGADLLTTTRLSIPEISAALGYSDRTKFEKAFKNAYDLTPTAYRRSQDQLPARKVRLAQPPSVRVEKCVSPKNTETIVQRPVRASTEGDPP